MSPRRLAKVRAIQRQRRVRRGVMRLLGAAATLWNHLVDGLAHVACTVADALTALGLAASTLGAALDALVALVTPPPVLMVSDRTTAVRLPRPVDGPSVDPPAACPVPLVSPPRR